MFLSFFRKNVDIFIVIPKLVLIFLKASEFGAAGGLLKSGNDSLAILNRLFLKKNGFFAFLCTSTANSKTYTSRKPESRLPAAPRSIPPTFLSTRDGDSGPKLRNPEGLQLD